MKSADFSAYINLCKSRGIAEYQVAAMLGCAVNSIPNWKRNGAPRYIALAISALEKKVDPWKENK